MAYVSPAEELYRKLEGRGADAEEIALRKGLEQHLLGRGAALHGCCEQNVHEATGLLAGETMVQGTEGTESVGNHVDRFEESQAALRQALLFLASDPAVARWDAEAN